MPDSSIKTEILIHDLKVPLSVIDAGAKSMLNRPEVYGPLTEKQAKVLRRIIRNATVTQRLVNDVLELGRSREGVMHLTEFTLGDLITQVLVEVFDLSHPGAADAVRRAGGLDAVAEAAGSGGIRLDISARVWETRVRLDAPKTRQIVRNLLTNAVKHRREIAGIRGELPRGTSEVVLGVWDDGRGIPPQDHVRIFDTYFTTGGSIESAIESHGLGLAGVMILLKDMGGSLKLLSEDGQGAEFRITLPLKL